MATDLQLSLAFVVVFLIFIMDCKQFFVLFIMSIVIALMAAYIDYYFTIPSALQDWVILIFAMISIFGVSKSIHLANKSYKKGKLQIQELE